MSVNLPMSGSDACARAPLGTRAVRVPIVRI